MAAYSDTQPTPQHDDGLCRVSEIRKSQRRLKPSRCVDAVRPLRRLTAVNHKVRHCSCCTQVLFQFFLSLPPSQTIPKFAVPSNEVLLLVPPAHQKITCPSSA